VTDWWRNRKPPERASWWNRRRRVVPEPALRWALLQSMPSTAGTSPVAEVEPTSVDWLLRAQPSQNIDGSTVRVAAVPATEEATSARAPIKRTGQTSGIAVRGPATDPGLSLADRLRLVLQPPLESLLPGPDTILEWPAELLSYQIDGVRALLDRDRILLADDMGLGKTVQAIAAMRILCLRRQVMCALLVVPASLINQWRREIDKWAPELRQMPIRGTSSERAWQWRAEAHVTIVSYETLRTDYTDNPDSPPRRRLWDLVILDEAQKIKNRDVEVSREAKGLRRRRSWAMTGTPLENKVEDLASILEFVDHTDGGPPVHFVPGPDLLARHAQLQLRRRKADVLTQLPPKQVIEITLPLLPRQQQSYTKAEREGIVELKARGETIQVQHVLELITRLKQICNIDPASDESAKLDDVRQRLRVLDEEGHRALLFSQYTDDTFGVAAIARELGEFRPLTFTGSMSGPARDQAIREFKDNPLRKILVLSLKAGGVGLNLQEASYVFHIDRWWNPAVERQAEDRSHRMGQLVPVTVFKYTCEATIEERIQAILASKQQLFDEIIDDVSLDVASRLTSDELFGLFDLEKPVSVGRAEAAKRSSGLDFEERCARVLEARGWRVQRTPRSHDGGVDLIAGRIDEVGLEQTIYIQCKDYARPVGVEVVRELIGILPVTQPAQAVLAARSGVTAEARGLADRRGVKIWDEGTLVALESAAE
jgi:superfamily II DNA or RNA helicase